MGYRCLNKTASEVIESEFRLWRNTPFTSGSPKPSETQIGGDHYKDLVIQPAYFCYVNKIPYLEATAIKYLCRWRKKNGIEDLKKAKHFIDLLIEFEHGTDT